MIGCHLVEIPAARQGLYRPFRFIPTAAQNPFTGCGVGYACLKLLAKFGERLYPSHVYGKFLKSCLGKVQVRIIKAGHHKAPTKINDFCVHTLESKYLFILANRLNAITANGDCLRALRYSERRGAADSRIDAAVNVR